jgi:hypothetical protein
MSSLPRYAYFEHPDGSWYRLWMTRTFPKTKRGHPWHVHATYDKTGTMASIPDTRWYEQPYGIANWDFTNETDAVQAFRVNADERLAHGYMLCEGTIPGADR